MQASAYEVFACDHVGIGTKSPHTDILRATNSVQAGDLPLVRLTQAPDTRITDLPALAAGRGFQSEATAGEAFQTGSLQFRHGRGGDLADFAAAPYQAPRGGSRRDSDLRPILTQDAAVLCRHLAKNSGRRPL